MRGSLDESLLGNVFPTFKSTARAVPLLLAAVAVLAVSLNEYQIFLLIHQTAGRDLIAVAHGVLDGHPPWRAFQARLLGPFAFAGFEAAMGWLRATIPMLYDAFERRFSLPGARDLAVLNGFVAIMIIAKNFTGFALLLRASGSLLEAAGGAILGSILCILLSHHWLYTWDLFEIIFFYCLAYIMFSGRNPGLGFLVLFVLALTNRESAVLFGIWLLCDAFARWHFDDDRRSTWREALTGAALVAITVVYVTVVRQSLTVESTLGHETGSALSMAPIFNPDGSILHEQALGTHLIVLENGLTFLQNLVSTRFYIDVYVVALIFHAVLLIKVALLRHEPRTLAIGLFNACLMAMILTFGLLNETRVFLTCVPFVVFSLLFFRAELLPFLSSLHVSRSRLLSARLGPRSEVEVLVQRRSGAS